MTLRLGRITLAALLISGLSFGGARAEDGGFDGRFLSARYHDVWLPEGFGQVSLRESSPVWDCAGGTCSLSSPLTAKIVFASTSGQPVAVTSQSLDFRLVATTNSQVLVDPLGQQWDVSADAGKWIIGVDIASQEPQGSDAQFATAYGRFGYTSPEWAVIPTWHDGFHFVSDPELGVIVAESMVLGLNVVGAVGVGPGHNGLPSSGGMYWSYQTHLDGASYAYPSTTDVHCASLSCMEFKTGIVNVNNYFLSFDVKATALAVPESGTLPLMALGLAGVALTARRRQR